MIAPLRICPQLRKSAVRWVCSSCQQRSQHQSAQARPALASLNTQKADPDRRSLGLPSRSISISHKRPKDSDPISSIDPADLPVYQRPTKGLLANLPASWVPFAELARLDKPAGAIYLFLPCVFGTLLAAPLAAAPPAVVVSTTALFATGALIMRGAGCTINDLWDRNLDPHVARTRLRPLARRAVTPRAAFAFFSAQCAAGLGLLLQFPGACVAAGVPSMVLVATYPLAKRVTYYPQVVLGTAFSWGAILGFPAMGVDLLVDGAAATGAAALYMSCICWTVLYDMIYAHMDIRDDVGAGIKSIALAHANNTKAVLSGLAVVQIGLLATAGFYTGAGPVFFIGSCGGALLTLGNMIWRVKLDSVADCWWWFRNGAWITGGVLSLGLLGDYVVRVSGNDGVGHQSNIQEPASAL